MKILLDTHVLLWMLDNNVQLSEPAKRHIANTNNQCYVSVASLFEIAIKKKIGKLDTPHSILSFVKEIEKVSLTLLAISPAYLEEYQKIPLLNEHKDPFDRLLIATAMTEDLNIITADDKFKLYKDLVNVVW